MAHLPRGYLRRVWNLSTLSLVVLVVQNSLLAVMTRLSRKDVRREDSYHSSTLVLNQEIVKMIACLLLFWGEVPEKLVVPVSELAPGVTETAVVVLTTTKDKDDDHEEVTAAAGTSPFLGPGQVHAKGGRHTTQRDANLPGTTAVPISSPVAATATPPRRPPRAPATRRVRGYMEYFRLTILTRDTMLLLVPAALFTFQNFAVFVSLTYLDAVNYQIWSQSKLLTAALFSVWMLHRRLAWGQWMCLVLLVVGVLVTQLGGSVISLTSTSNTVVANQSAVSAHALSSLTTTTTSTRAATVPAGGPQRPGTTPPTHARLLGAHEQKLIGIISCVLSGISSSFAGVYFEKVVKTTAPSLAVRNIQLSLFGIPLAVLTMLCLDVLPNYRRQSLCVQTPLCFNIFVPCTVDGAAPPSSPLAGIGECPVRPFYFWQRYDVWLTWGLVGIHALGGLLVALVVKYADNIVKGFATGISIIVSGLLSSVIWGYVPSSAFFVGSAIITLATVLFHKLEPKRAAK